MKKSITSIHPDLKKVEQRQKKGQGSKTTETKKIPMAFLYIQLVLTLIVIILGVMTLVKIEILPILQVFLGITLIDMGINNQLIYHRKWMSYFYIGIGVIVLLFFIASLLGL